MPFPRCKVKFNMAFGSCQRETSTEDPETGISITRMEDCNKKLPDAEYYQIQNQIKAGVTLNEVNTKIINNNNGVNVDELENAIETVVKKSRKNQTKNEVNDET